MATIRDPDAVTHAARDPARHGGTVVVIERDREMRDLITYYLATAGHSVSEASGGAEAMGLVESLRPDLVITEILVPRPDGLALCRRIKGDASLRDTRVLVLSILSAERRARDAGADAFLRKPLNEQRFLATAERLIQGWKEQAV